MSIQWKLQCLKWKKAFKITLFWNWMVLICAIQNGYGMCRITSLTLFLTTALVNHWLKFSNDALHGLKSWSNICIFRYLHFPFVSCIEAYRYQLYCIWWRYRNFRLGENEFLIKCVTCDKLCKYRISLYWL